MNRSTQQLQTRLPLVPEGTEILSPDLAVARRDEKILFLNASGPIYSCSEGDRLGQRIAGAIFAELGLASGAALAKGLGVHPSTVCRDRAKFKIQGSARLQPQKRGPRGAHKLHGRILSRTQGLLDQGIAIREIARRIGISEGTVRHGLKTARLRSPKATMQEAPTACQEQQVHSKHLHAPRSLSHNEVAEPEADQLSAPGARAAEDVSCQGGVAVKRVAERALARTGRLHEAAPEFRSAEGVAHAGVLLALPALLEQGLLEVTEKVYGSLRNGFFGLRATMLALAFMALLRVRTPEQLTSHAPGELGHLLGLDRFPEVKTLRRKLAEMGERERASVVREEFARHWVESDPKAVGILYVDGHVRPYNGRKHVLPKAHVPRRRLCMPATTDFWVNDVDADPVFFVTAPANDGMLSMLDKEVLPEVRDLVGKRRVSLVFDREGWSPKRFSRWKKAGFDVITYRKGPYDDWPETEFSEKKGRIDGRSVKYTLAERELELVKGFPMREVRKLCDDAHQVSIVTTIKHLGPVAIAYRISSRWRQENFFRYMRQEFALDHLCTYVVDPADPERTVPNPQRREKDKELAALRAEQAKLKQDYAERLQDNPESKRRTVRGFKIANAELGTRIQQLESHCQAIEEQRRLLPQRVPVKDLVPESEIVQLERERKTLTDVIKMVAYRAETSLAQSLRPFSSRHEDEARKLLKAVFQLPANLIADEAQQLLKVRLHGMANGRSNRALQALCEVMTAKKLRYPGTGLRMVFQTV